MLTRTPRIDPGSMLGLWTNGLALFPVPAIELVLQVIECRKAKAHTRLLELKRVINRAFSSKLMCNQLPAFAVPVVQFMG